MPGPASLIFRALTLGPYYGHISRRLVGQVLRSLKGTSPPIVDWLHYGATYVNLKHLAIWLLVRTTADLERACAEGLDRRVGAATKEALGRNGYPADAIPGVHVGLESVENIERAGGAHKYFH